VAIDNGGFILISCPAISFYLESVKYNLIPALFHNIYFYQFYIIGLSV
jgi:hypothetical protein